MNAGEAVNKKSHISLVPYWFSDGYEKYVVSPGKWMLVKKIRIKQENEDQLEILAVAEDGTIEGRRIIKKGVSGFSCQDGWIKIAGSMTSGTTGSIGYADYIWYFTRDGGHLVVKEEYKSFGLILIIPIAGSGTRWYRFSRIEDSGGDLKLINSPAP